jgi:hypothetical protein
MKDLVERWEADGQADIVAAIGEFHAALPGWWYSIGLCHVSADASCGPDRAGVDADLLKDRVFDEGFHADLNPPATMADALRAAMQQGLAARALKTKGAQSDDR